MAMCARRKDTRKARVVRLNLKYARRVRGEYPRTLHLVEYRVVRRVDLVAPVHVRGEQPLRFALAEHLHLVRRRVRAQHHVFVHIVAVRFCASGVVRREREFVEVFKRRDEGRNRRRVREVRVCRFNHPAQSVQWVSVLEMQLCRDLAQNGRCDVGEVVSWELLPQDVYMSISLSGRRSKARKMGSKAST